MKLPNFLFIDPTPPLMGAGFILSTTRPFIMAKVYKFKSHDEMAKFQLQVADYAQQTIQGYNLLLTHYTSLLDYETKSQVKDTLQHMANWYLNNKIQTHEPAYKRYKQT